MATGFCGATQYLQHDADPAREQRLKRLQMEALGFGRAEYTRTVDFKENYHHLDAKELESLRKSNIAGTKEAAAVQGKEGVIAGWSSAWKTFENENDSSGDEIDIGTGIGQSHRHRIQQIETSQVPHLKDHNVGRKAPPNSSKVKSTGAASAEEIQSASRAVRDTAQQEKAQRILALGKAQFTAKSSPLRKRVVPQSATFGKENLAPTLASTVSGSIHQKRSVSKSTVGKRADVSASFARQERLLRDPGTSLAPPSTFMNALAGPIQFVTTHDSKSAPEEHSNLKQTPARVGNNAAMPSSEVGNTVRQSDSIGFRVVFPENKRITELSPESLVSKLASSSSSARPKDSVTLSRRQLPDPFAIKDYNPGPSSSTRNASTISAKKASSEENAAQMSGAKASTKVTRSILSDVGNQQSEIHSKPSKLKARPLSSNTSHISQIENLLDEIDGISLDFPTLHFTAPAPRPLAFTIPSTVDQSHSAPYPSIHSHSSASDSFLQSLRTSYITNLSTAHGRPNALLTSLDRLRMNEAIVADGQRPCPNGDSGNESCLEVATAKLNDESLMRGVWPGEAKDVSLTSSASPLHAQSSASGEI